MGKSNMYYVYIMNSPSGTLYTGITNDLHKRVYQHKQKLVKGFTQQYNVVRLANFEETMILILQLPGRKRLKVGEGARRLN